jgi:cell division protein FtsQ
VSLSDTWKRSTKPAGPPPNRRRSSAPPAPRLSRLRPRLLRWGRRAAELCVLLAAIAGLVVLGRWTHTYATTSPHFEVGPAQVSGNQRVTAEELQRLSGLTPGTNIFAVSPDEAARRVARHPWIATAAVRRRLPSQITIEVTEREAIALLRVGGLYLIDAEGTVFKRVEAGDPVDLPIITGVDVDRYREDRPGSRTDLLEALELLRLFEENGLSAQAPLSEIHLEADGELSLYTVDDATHIRLGRPPFRRKLQRLARLFRELRDQQAVADYIYLEEGDEHIQPDRAVVRLRVEDEDPPAPPARVARAQTERAP